VLQNAAAARMLMGYASHPISSFLLNALDCNDMRALINKTLDSDSGPIIVSKEVILGQSTYMVNVSPVSDELSGEIAGVVAVLRDITTLKKLETVKSLFVSMVAHEIKSPLTAVEGYLNLILSDMVEKDPKREQKMLQRSLLRLRTLRMMISELMNITAIETGYFTLKRSRLDIEKVVSEAVELYREKAQEKDIELSMRVEGNPELGHVLADKEAMRIIFTNLIDNSVKYTPDKGHVWIHTEQNGLYVKVKVKDDGIGMLIDEKERIFDEFFRAKNAYTAHVPGTGLGLSLVKRLLDMHHGTITVETAPGKGSEFTVSIPIER
jgi:two-component system phosphate regulon sensor histidine kinase PhoR